MKDSADIRKINKYKILKILWKGESHTKQQLSLLTGLSTATCNTLLNEMEESGVVTGQKIRLQEVGRSSVCYRINDEFESFLCLYFDLREGRKILTLNLLAPGGKIIAHEEQCCDELDYALIAGEIEKFCRDHFNLTQIIVGVPGIVEHGIIGHCDIHNLDNVPLKERLEHQFKLPVHLENDMHLKAYGYYCKMGKNDEIITLLNFPSGVLPGTASVYAGVIIKGKNQFAGMTGFLPQGVSLERQIELMKKDTCRPFVSNSVCSLIAIINPGIMVLTGDLFDEKSIEWIKEDCLKYIPAEYIPQFIYKDTFDDYYLEGMYHKALDLKGEFIQ